MKAATAAEREQAVRLLHDMALRSPLVRPQIAGVQVVRVADVEAEQVRWFWHRWVPKSKLTILDGDPGLGKSTLALDLAARASTGSPLPDGDATERRAVVILSAEDGIADTIRPRLEAHGADLHRIVVLSAIEDNDSEPRPPELPGDVGWLEKVIVDERAGLVIVDPLMAFLAGDVNTHRDHDVRRALHALAAMAERTGASVLAIRHLNKTGGTRPLYRGGGSIGIIGAARSGLLVSADPDDKGRRVLACTKANLAEAPESLVFRLVRDELRDCGRIVWEGSSKHSADDLLRLGSSDADDRSAVEEAKEFLQAELSEGSRSAKPLIALARDAGISEKTLRRAKNELGVKAVKTGFEGGWEWALPEDGQGGWPPSREEAAGHLRETPLVKRDSGPSDGPFSAEDGQPSDMPILGAETPLDGPSELSEDAS